MRRTGGTAVLTVLLVGSLLAMVFFVTAALVSIQLGLVGHQEQRQRSRNLAESAAALAIARLVENQDFGLAPGGTVQVPGLGRDSFGGVSFDGAAASPLGLTKSCNNLKGDASIAGSLGGVLPPHSAQILALGRCGEQLCRLEVILHIPRYPYDVACSGPIRCNGNLLVASVREPAVLAAGAAAVREEDLQPGLLACNALDVGSARSVQMQGAGVRVVGDLQSVGSIGLDPAVTVSGEVRPHSAPAPLPTIDLHDYDTAGKPGLRTLSSTSAPLQLGGFSRHQGHLTLGGGLELQNGVLFVDGDLDVQGGIQGKGAVIVTGATRVSGGGSLGTQSMAALLSGGSLTIQGTATQSASFQGLVYSGKSLATRYADVAGLLVCNDPTGQGPMTLENSHVFHLPEASKIEFAVQPPATPGSWQAPSAALFHWTVPLPPPPPSPSPPSPVQSIQLNISGLPYYDQSAGAATARWVVKANDPCISHWDALVNGNSNPAYYQGEIDHYERTGSTQRQGLHWCVENILQAHGVPTDADYLASLERWLDARQAELVLSVQAKADALNAAGTVPPVSQPGSSTPGSTSGPQEWSLDLSRFMNLGDQIRIQQWREI